ncbi:unnamed protein product [Vitrella brassicaformis CCMP3155]|uniref:Uncharacterized protein n=1 Tax=Vitrella brassicaformis (strain CCMP3155) TaxID=1169540 RepID=A0A0G4GKQ3_VITBC|nr:unnamed protein product [Vitrella brassicaformis CCMP3155]|eukprot:CEM30598.1 unnamed protein product [Vitrella brassicaformis CCMP3155]
MLFCLEIPAGSVTESGDIDAGHRLVEAVCQLLAETVAAHTADAGQRLLVVAIVKLLQQMINVGDELVTEGKATSNPFVDQIVQCEAIQQLRRRRDLPTEVTSFIQSLPKTVKVCSSSAAPDRSHRPAKHKTTAHIHSASGPPSPPCSPSPQPSSPVDTDALVDGLLSDDIETFTSAAKAIADRVTSAFVKRLAVRFGKEKELFRRLLMRLVDSGNEKCQLAAANVLYCLVRSTFLSEMGPSDRVSAVQDIFDIVTWTREDLSSEGGVGGDLGAEVDSFVASAIIAASSGGEPVPSTADEVTYMRLCVITAALQEAVTLDEARRLQLRVAFLQTH